MFFFNKLMLSVLTLSLSLSSAFAGEWDKLPAAKQTKAGLYLHTTDAYKFTTENKDKVLFLDVRTKEEVQFLGMATVVDANIPYMQNSDWFDWNEKGKKAHICSRAHLTIRHHKFNRCSLKQWRVSARG